MEAEKHPDSLEQVRAARQEISARFEHDPEKLLAHYMALQQQYRDRLVPPPEPEKSE